MNYNHSMSTNGMQDHKTKKCTKSPLNPDTPLFSNIGSLSVFLSILYEEYSHIFYKKSIKRHKFIANQMVF